MAPKSKASVPDYKNIPHAHRVPANTREVQRIFSKLSRHSLISLALQWLAKKNRDFCRPYLLGDSDGEEQEEEEQYAPAQSLEELQEIYKQLAARKGGKREVQDRILEGDWRTGISMYQLATADIQYLLDHTNSLRWTAKRLARIPNAKSAALDMEVTNDSDHLPRFQASTFMANLARELTPLMKAHYLLTKIKTLPMTILRIYMHDSPYSTEASVVTEMGSSDSAKAVFFIWPNGSPFVYSSIANHLGQGIGDDGRHLRDIVQQAIPKAFSRPSARYQLAGTNFTTKSLDALLTYRGSGKSNAAAGGWSVFQDHSFSQNALDFITSQSEKHSARTHTTAGAQDTTAKTPAVSGSGRPVKHTLDSDETPESKRRREVVEGRFGTSALPGDGQGLERFEVRIDDAFPQSSASGQDVEEPEDSEAWAPDVRVVFQGTHVFAGIRQLAEQGVIDGEAMPGWMTGEAGVTVAAVKDGRIRTKNGHVLGA